MGCDWIVDSTLEEDECGVCGGNGSDCRTIQGLYNKGTTTQTGYSEVHINITNIQKLSVPWRGPI